MPAIRDAQWKLLHIPDGSRLELYDLDAGPAETRNVAADHDDVIRRLSERSLPDSPVRRRWARHVVPWRFEASRVLERY